jgi:hypothetical protein
VPAITRRREIFLETMPLLPGTDPQLEPWPTG